jgi:translation initiation factor eIF-2B subunit delta
MSQPVPTPKPKTTKAERRALQEKQRADKALAQGKQPPPPQQQKASASQQQQKPSTSQEKQPQQPQQPQQDKQERQQQDKQQQTKPVAPHGAQSNPPSKKSEPKASSPSAPEINKTVEETPKRKVSLFDHIPQSDKNFPYKVEINNTDIHPAIIRLGLKFAEGTITGSKARCIALLVALKNVVEDYITPPGAILKRDLDARINTMMAYLAKYRPIALSMQNIINWLQVLLASTNLSENQVKQYITKEIDDYLKNFIGTVAPIAAYVLTKIKDGDVILTYARSHVVEESLRETHLKGKKFRVIVVDSKPHNEGRALVKRLLDDGLECSYTQINAVSYIMKDVTKVLIGASSVLGNGSVLSRIGTAVIAMTAHANHVPVIVCCESFKFSEKVLLDSICWNELGDPDDVVEPGQEDLANWHTKKNLKLLNLKYDVTPVEYVDMVIFENGIIPPTSAPVVLREYRRDLL